MTTKQLTSIMTLWIDGGVQISYTFDEIDSDTGEIISRNNKRSFFVVDSTLLSNVEAIRDYIRINKF